MVEHLEQSYPTNPEKQQELQKLEQLREKQITRLFWYALEIALVFLIPAAVAAFLVTKLISKAAAWYALPFSFLLSWGIVIFRYRHLSRELGSLDKRIKELRNQKD